VDGRAIALVRRLIDAICTIRTSPGFVEATYDEGQWWTLPSARVSLSATVARVRSAPSGPRVPRALRRSWSRSSRTRSSAASSLRARRYRPRTRFGYHKAVMREALKLLEAHGLVRVEQGRGSTVQPRESWNLLDSDVLRIALEYDNDIRLFDNVVKVRLLLETAMVREATLLLTDDDLAVLQANLDAMAELIDDYPHFRELDQSFHRTLHRASGNEVGWMIIRAIHTYTAADCSRPGSERALRRTVTEHTGILEALKKGDGELAAERVAEHIKASWVERRARRLGEE
jgi:GntR family galactonate operon transcriptional repressor